jgi:hypothetical protein
MQKNQKICSNITMVEVQTWTPLEKIQCDNIFGRPILCFHPHHVGTLNVSQHGVMGTCGNVKCVQGKQSSHVGMLCVSQ